MLLSVDQVAQSLADPAAESRTGAASCLSVDFTRSAQGNIFDAPSRREDVRECRLADSRVSAKFDRAFQTT